MKLAIFFLLFFVSMASASLKVGFYGHSCPQAESIVHSVVQEHFESDPSITAALLRMHFHDCFVRGCDASILINPTKKKQTEKLADPNLTVRGFNLIDKAKSRLESECPSIVSCSDVIVLATRDAVALSGGPNYAVPTGRRDGRVSNVIDVDLPGPTTTVEEALEIFRSKGLTLQDMVVLLGSHTVGIAHCGFFRDRLFGFGDTRKPDPTMDPDLRVKLAKHCSRTDMPITKDPVVFLDQGTSSTIDNQYYNQIMNHRGILQIDQELALNNSTARIAEGLRQDRDGFLSQFADALVKLGNVQVLEGRAGEIRKHCGVVN